MTKRPTVVLMLTTYKRPEYAEITIASAIEHLKYEGQIRWYVADAEGKTENLAMYKGMLGKGFVAGHSLELTPGKNWNLAIENIYEHTPIYLRLEDDFVLNSDFDITEFVNVLMDNEKVGMIRLGLVPINLRLNTVVQKTFTSVGYDQNIYLNVSRETQYCFSGHPSLVHARFHEAYGMFDEEANPGQCELNMDASVRRKPDGPDIWIPWKLGAYGTWGAWGHIGEKKSY